MNSSTKDEQLRFMNEQQTKVNEIYISIINDTIF
jgi:hypothetical protein